MPRVQATRPLPRQPRLIGLGELGCSAAPFHPSSTKANNLTPKYRFWNRYSYNYYLREAASLDSRTGAYPTSRPDGVVSDTSPDNKLYPFKYKTAEQPMRTATRELIALDTYVFFREADPTKRSDAAVRAGLRNMKYPDTDAYTG